MSIVVVVVPAFHIGIASGGAALACIHEMYTIGVHPLSDGVMEGGMGFRRFAYGDGETTILGKKRGVVHLGTEPNPFVPLPLVFDEPCAFTDSKGVSLASLGGRP